MVAPFTHLDAQTRHFLEEDLLKLCGEGQRTIMFVTHDLDEAIGLGDRVVVLSSGPASRVLRDDQVGIPRPRDLLGIRAHPRFGELSQLLWKELAREVGGTYAR